ncbi:hypothetical protein ABLT40_06875 [Acinetobacter schindleri]
MLSITDLKIAVIGLGYVGLPLAVEFGKKYLWSVLISTKNELMNWKVSQLVYI